MEPCNLFFFSFSFVALSFFFRFIACDDPTYLYDSCPYTTLYETNSSYQSNLHTLLSSLSSNATFNAYCNATIGGSPNTVYGLYYCRGDITRDACRDCVNYAAKDIVQRCHNGKVEEIGYEECTFRYSNQFIFSIVSDSNVRLMSNLENISDPTQFNQLLGKKMNEIATEAASDSNKLATQETPFTQSKNLYCLAQCSPDLSKNDCYRCLVDAISYLPSCCSGNQGGRVLSPSCNVRFEVYPFYASALAPSPSLVPPPSPSNRTTIPGELLIEF